MLFKQKANVRRLIVTHIRGFKMFDDFPNAKEYKKSIVAFIDILGFNSKIKKIKNEADFYDIAKLLYALKKEADSLNKDQELFQDFTLLAVSDSLIITVPYTSPIATFGVIQMIRHIQYTLIATKFRTIVRGYITIGDVYHKDGLLFGPGYSEAYEYESKIGYAPRVVLSPNIIKDAKSKIEKTDDPSKFIRTIFDYIKKDPDDDQFYIDYLKPYGNSAGGKHLPLHKQLEEMETIKSFIKKCINNFKDKVAIRQKYEWILNYHNEALKGY